jgi:phosphopantetheinyl transferase
MISYFQKQQGVTFYSFHISLASCTNSDVIFDFCTPVYTFMQLNVDQNVEIHQAVFDWYTIV